MLRKILPIVLVLIGAGGGVGAGLALRPAPDPATEAEAAPKPQEIDPESLPEYVKLNNQFVIPVLDKGRVSAMVILSVSLEVVRGKTQDVYGREPKLRDAMLQVLFEHANAGGFAGAFTDGANLILLRKALLEAATNVVGASVSDILISDIARQDT